MKYLQLFTLLILASSCCSTKRVTDTASNETETLEIVKDSIISENEIIVTETETPEPPKPPKIIEVDVIDDYAPEAFNHNSWNSLLKKHVTISGNVNYKDFKSNRTELAKYITRLGENTPNDTWNKQDKLAYWINAYNAMTIDLILRNYPIKSIKDIKDPWDQRLWKLSDKWYNLNEIEHQILRKMNEPRIHFAIVCASFSCPKLQNEAYIASNLEEQLTNATKEFLIDSKRNEISENSIKLSKIFQWFAKDFKQDGGLTDFLNKYSAITISAKAKKSFKNYDWALNE